MVIWRFRTYHGIWQLLQKLSANSETPELFREKVIEQEGFTLNQVYNCDETGLYFRILPKKTLATASEKEYQELMACVNSKGTHKLPLLHVYMHVF